MTIIELLQEIKDDADIIKILEEYLEKKKIRHKCLTCLLESRLEEGK